MQTINLTDLPVAPPALDWQIEFGLFLRRNPSQKNRARSQKTLQAYESDIRLMAEWFEGKYRVRFEPGDMNQVNLQEYFAQFENSPKTHKRKRASIRLLIRWARLNGVLDHDPSEWIPVIEEVDDSPRDLLPEEEARIRAVAEALEAEGTLLGQRDSLFLHLMLDAGLRISEAIELKRSDLANLEKGTIHVFGKGAKHRNPHVRVSLANRIRLWLDRMPVAIEGTLITAENGTAITRGYAWTRFKMIADAAGVICTPHTMRHQFVMNLITAYMRQHPGQEIKAVKAACRETGDDIKVMLKYYTSPRESEIRAAVEAM